MAEYQMVLDAAWQLNVQHSGATGYIALAEKRNGWRESYYTSRSLSAVSCCGGADVYSSQNSFAYRSRRVSNVKQLRSLYVDLDCHKVGLSPEQALWQMENDFFGSILPMPNLIVFSGRGLAVIWLLKPAPAAAMPLWQFAQDWITKQLEHLGADSAASDAARVLRLAGTINSKNGATVQVFESHTQKLDLKDWKREWLPTKKEKKAKVENNKNSVSRLLNIYTLNYQRMIDIRRLVSLRGGACEGHREIMLFLYRYYGLLYYKDKKSALDSILDLNNKFTSPLPWRQVVQDTRSAERIIERGRQYNYSNRKLINILDITPDEQWHLKTIISKDEKYRRNNKRRENARRAAGKMDRAKYLSTQQKATQSRIMAICEILEKQPGIKQKDIAAQLKIDAGYVSRLMRKIKK